MAIALAAAQGILIVGLGAALGACARWVRTAQSYARAQRAALCILYMALVVCCAPIHFWALRRHMFWRGLCASPQAKRHGGAGAALYAAASAVALCAADGANALRPLACRRRAGRRASAP